MIERTNLKGELWKKFNSIPIYIDTLMDKKEILVGNKQGEGKKFIIMNSELYDDLESMSINDDRFKKLKEILDEI